QPPAEIVLKTDLSQAEMAKVGREIMDGKGLCLTCHTIGKTTGPYRFPDLANVAVRAKTRKPGYTDVDYFAESLYEPNAFIVPGFHPGMPTINKPPMGLTDQESLCVIASRQPLGGPTTVTPQPKPAFTGGPAPGAAPPAAK